MIRNEAETEYLVRLVQSRFGLLKLTHDQAVAIHHYERNIESARVEMNSPSIWEEKEIESHYFREVLDEQQFSEYKSHVARQIAQIEEEMVEQDKVALKGIQYESKSLAYYKDDLVPKLIAHRDKLRLTDRDGLQLKLDYLKSEYQNYLRVRWKEICINHFRNARHLQPYTFKEQQLRHEIEKIYPSWYFFKSKADEATKAVAKSLVGGLGYYVNKYQEFMASQKESMRLTNEALFEEFYTKRDSEERHIFKLDANLSDKERLENGFLSFMLIDPGRYE